MFGQQSCINFFILLSPQAEYPTMALQPVSGNPVPCVPSIIPVNVVSGEWGGKMKEIKRALL